MEYINEDNLKIKFITVLEDTENATIFHHFKGHDYKIVTFGKDSETLDDVVVYQGQYENNPVWVRTAKEFFSKVDKNKYPDIDQEYRFEIQK